MGRPAKTGEERMIHAPLPAPLELAPNERAIWEREMGRVPPGFFVPCDTAALRIFVDVMAEYEWIHALLTRANDKDRQKIAKEYRATTAQLLCLMRALRLLPHTRLHKNRAANMADGRALPEGASELEPNEGWRLMFPPKNRSN